MKIVTLLFLSCLLLSFAFAQEKKAYILFNAEGQEISYADMLETLVKQNVVFIGEIHNCPIAHWLEFEIIQNLYARHQDELMIGAEMFERDDQLVLDEYLNGTISTERFHQETKLWPNYKTDYAKIIEWAKTKKIPFIATNIPRRYANLVSRGGLEALTSLTDEAKQYIAPLPLEYVRNPEVEKYFSTKTMPGMKQGNAENLAKAQAIKDATMGWSIAGKIKSRFVHLNGSFHSANKAGIITYLNQYRPGLKIATIEVIRQKDIEKLALENKGRADFYICVPQNMTTTY